MRRSVPFIGPGLVEVLRVFGRIWAVFKAPSATTRFLLTLVGNAHETALRCERNSSGESWRLRLDRRAKANGILRGIGDELIGAPAPRYSVSPARPLLARRPRLLHIIANVFVGGSTQLVVDLHRGLGDAYEMDVLTAALPPGGPHAGMSIHRIGLDEPADRFVPLLAQIAPDLVHVHYWGSTDEPWYRPAFEAALERGIPVVQNINTPVAPYRDPRIAAHAFVSHYVRDSFAPDLATARVVYPGIDLAAFTPSPVVGRDVADTAIMVYRLDRDKLDDDAIDSAIEAVRLRPRTRVIVVGEGPLLPVFAARVRRAGCRANFDFRGAVPYAELPWLYAQAGVFLAPVARESFGQVVPFAMAMGLAVVGNRVGALPEILRSTDTLGRTPAETGAILARMLDDNEGLRRGREARIARARDFDLDTMIAAYRDLYSGVLTRGTGATLP